MSTAAAAASTDEVKFEPPRRRLIMCSQLGSKARVARGAMTNASYFEINAAQWHRTRLEQLLEHPTGASQCDGLLLLGFWWCDGLLVCCFGASGVSAIYLYLSCLCKSPVVFCTLQLSSRRAGLRDRAARRCGRRLCHLHREACSTMSGPSLSRVVALIDMDCFCAPPHTHATPQHTHLCNLPEQLPIPASSRLRLRTGARLIARGRAVSGGAVQPFPGRWLRQRLGSRLPAR